MKNLKPIYFLLLLTISLTTIAFTSCEKDEDEPETTDDTQINSDGKAGTLTDAEGNTYAIVKIGDQWWMVENLKVTKYNDGTNIPEITEATAWENDSIGAYCDYNNDITNVKYGRLYNWYAVNTGKLAPVGWHVATDAEWTILNTYVSSNYGASGSIAKALAATTDWWSTSTITGAPGNDLSTNNSTGFCALPGGSRDNTGGFGDLGNSGYWWSATEYSSTHAWHWGLGYNGPSMDHYSLGCKECGFSVRCVRD